MYWTAPQPCVRLERGWVAAGRQSHSVQEGLPSAHLLFGSACKVQWGRAGGSDRAQGRCGKVGIVRCSCSEGGLRIREVRG